MKRAIGHLAFAVLMCLRQAKAGRTFMFEHPGGASPWATAMMNKLLFVKDGARVNFDFCMLGMRSKDQDGEGSAKKKTGIMTNSPMLTEELKKFQCNKEHRHVTLMNGRAHKC